MAVIDASNSILGRLSTVVARRLLSGEEIKIVNAEKAVISGRKEYILNKFRVRLTLKPKGDPTLGPHYPKMPDRILRSAIRGMLPFKRESGRKAYKNLTVYIGVPGELKNEKFELIEDAENTLGKGFMSVAELSKELGARWQE